MPSYLEFDVSLKFIKPKVWRRFLIVEGASFEDLHRAIQDACGWENSHLFAFRTDLKFGEVIAGVSDLKMEMGHPLAKKVKLTSYFTGETDRCIYVYDFGDDWVHEVKLRQRVELPEKFKRRLLDGKRAFPPEDCGGEPGYDRLVKFLKTGIDPYGEDPDDLREWLDGWEPEAFDLEKVKRTFDR